jgi:hypothetical protein
MGDIFIRHRRLLAANGACWQQTAMPNESDKLLVCRTDYTGV